MTDWFADDTLWAELYDFEFPRAVLDAGDTQAERAIRLSGVERGDVLDLACGPGRHAIPLARRGFRVTAVDLSPFHLAKARQRAEAARVSIELVQADMRAFRRPDAFDLALNLFTSFDYFDEAKDSLQVLTNIHESLRPGGVLVLDVIGKERVARVLQPTVSQRGPDGALLVRRHEVLENWTRIKNEWTIVRDGRARTFELMLRLYSGQELIELLGAAGFQHTELYGHFDGRPYDLEAERLVAVASR